MEFLDTGGIWGDGGVRTVLIRPDQGTSSVQPSCSQTGGQPWFSLDSDGIRDLAQVPVIKQQRTKLDLSATYAKELARFSTR